MKQFSCIYRKRKSWLWKCFLVILTSGPYDYETLFKCKLMIFSFIKYKDLVIIKSFFWYLQDAVLVLVNTKQRFCNYKTVVIAKYSSCNRCQLNIKKWLWDNHHCYFFAECNLIWLDSRWMLLSYGWIWCNTGIEVSIMVLWQQQSVGHSSWRRRGGNSVAPCS